MANPLRPSPLSLDSPRQSPFKRQNSNSPASVRATPPPPSHSGYSPTKASSLSPEKTSPFVRRPSQINQTPERPSSPFTRPTSGLGIPPSPSRQSSSADRSDETPPVSPRVTPAPESKREAPQSPVVTAKPTPSPFDGTPSSPAPESPSVSFPSQSSLRPAAQRPVTSSTSTTKQPPFNPNITKATTTTVAQEKPTTKSTMSNTGTAYKNVPQGLLRSMREAFEVLDSNNSGSVTSASVASMLDQMGMSNSPADLRDFFPPNAPSQLNLARYLDTLSAPLSDLSPPEELLAAFSAFDVDDSGQIDVSELRKALLDTAPEPGETEMRLSAREMDAILGEFAGRRAFGAKGVSAAKGKGEVFRYREFMGSVLGGGADAGGGEGVAAA